MEGSLKPVTDSDQDPRYQDAVKVLDELESAGFPARLAGGCVRDRLRGVTPADYDVVTAATPPQVIQTMKAVHRKVIPTGIDHGTVTVLAGSTSVEVTTLRLDVSTDGRRAVVSFGAGFEEDALRRDFTINALFEDRSGKIYDYVGGLSDLKAQALRFVGDPTARIYEDGLRILRFFRFWARLGFEPAPGTLEALTPLTHRLAKISQERITSELFQILEGPALPKVLSALMATGTLMQVDPLLGEGVMELDRLASRHRSLFENHGKDSPPLLDLPSPWLGVGYLTLLALLGKSDHLVDLGSWANQLKLKNRDKKLLVLSETLGKSMPQATAALGETLDFLSLCDRYGPGFGDFYDPIWKVLSDADETVDSAPRRSRIGWPGDFGIRLSHLKRVYTSHGHLLKQSMPLDGGDIQTALGLKSSVVIGHLLQKARHAWYSGHWYSKTSGIKWLTENLTNMTPMDGSEPHEPHPSPQKKP